MISNIGENPRKILRNWCRHLEMMWKCWKCQLVDYSEGWEESELKNTREDVVDSTGSHWFTSQIDWDPFHKTCTKLWNHSKDFGVGNIKARNMASAARWDVNISVVHVSKLNFLKWLLICISKWRLAYNIFDFTHCLRATVHTATDSQNATLNILLIVWLNS